MDADLAALAAILFGTAGAVLGMLLLARCL